MRRNMLLDAEDIERILRRITDEILETHKTPENLALVGIHTRGVYLARRIRQLIARMESIEVDSGEIDINLYRDDWTRIAHHPEVRSSNIGFDIDRKEIVLIDDVLYTGRTVRSAMDALIDFGRPRRIELCVLIDRGHRELPIQANFAGKIIETGRGDQVNVMLTECDGEDRVDILTPVD